MMKTCVCSVAVVVLGLVDASADAATLNLRQWVDVNGFSNNSASNEWQGRIGSATGTLMTASSTSWTTPAVQFSVPLIGPLTSPGSDNGAAGPATFDGLWVHPGSGVDAVVVFAPQAAVDVTGLSVHHELIANGLSGNGVRFLAYLTLSGVTTQIGSSVAFGGTSTDGFSDFTLPNAVTLNPGDTLALHVNDNGSYLFDHVNFDVTVTIPAPGLLAAAAPLGLIGLRRRR